MNDKEKRAGTVDFTGGDQNMKDAIARAKASKVPVGGVPMPQMPRLDQPPPSAQGTQAVRAAQRILTPEEQQKLQEQGRFIPGAGSAYAANQPALQTPAPTDTEGAPQPIDPRTAPRPPGSGLRPDTVQALQAVAAANSDDKELDKINKDIEDEEDVYEDNEFGERVKSLLGNKKRAASIEARCQPMSFDDLLMYGSVKQKVPIIPGKFEPTFKSLLGEENEEILRLMGSVRGPDQYILDVMSLYQLTCGLYSVNSRVLPDHLDKNGDFNEEMFRAKYKMVRKMALPILADLDVNFRWFTKRVQKLTVVDDIKTF